MPFEEFDKRSAAASKSPFVTLQKRGPLSLNKAAYELLGAPEAVTLLYDREEQLIGLNPADQGNPRAFPLRPQGERASNFLIAGQAFTQYYGIDTSTARRYGVDLRDGVLIVDLKSENTEVTGPRARSREREPA